MYAYTSSLISTRSLMVHTSHLHSYVKIFRIDYDNVNISDLRKGKRENSKKQSSGKRPKKSRDVSTLRTYTL